MSSASVKGRYLLAYNGAMAAGWAAILVRLLSHFMSGGARDTYYTKLRSLLVICQTTAVLEVLHAATGIVRSPVFTTAVQVASRVFVLYGSLEIGSRKVTESRWAVQMICAWAISEILRYSYYVAGIVTGNKVPTQLTWARYSGFMLLYPLGITGEIGCLYNALDHVRAHGTYSVRLPNSMNFAFDFAKMIWAVLLGLYPGGSYTMYTYMLSQRRKMLAGSSA